MLLEMNYFLIILSVCHFSGLIVVNATENVTLCRTPNNISGECKNIQSCHGLLSIVTRRFFNSSVVDYLLQSQCKGQSDNRIVCCPVTDSLSLTSLNTEDKMSLLPNNEICGLGVDNKIYGGTKTGIREFPWLVSVQVTRGKKKRSHHCGGVLINSRYVLTAAHCLRSDAFSKVTTVRLGEHNLDTDPDCVEGLNGNEECAPPSIAVDVEEKIVHEQYISNTNRYNDIALLRLNQEVNFTGYIQPICLPKSPEVNIPIGKRGTVAGWGKTEFTTVARNAEKLKVDVPLQNNSVCTNAYRGINVLLSTTQICAGGELNKDSCKGDSGGPLMGVYAEGASINWYCIGIVSYGPTPCGQENQPGVYVNVSNYYSWIVSKLKK